MMENQSMMEKQDFYAPETNFRLEESKIRILVPDVRRRKEVILPVADTPVVKIPAPGKCFH